MNRLLHPFRRWRLKSRLAERPGIRRILLLCLGNVCRSPYGAARLVQLAQDGSSGEDEGGPRVGATDRTPSNPRSGTRLADGTKMEVRSAGLMGFGNPSPETARGVAGQRGLDLDSHSSQLITPELVAWADLLVVMDPDQGEVLKGQFGASPDLIVILGDLDPALPGRRDIPDPIHGDEAFFTDTFARIDRCLEELFTLIRGPQ